VRKEIPSCGNSALSNYMSTSLFKSQFAHHTFCDFAVKSKGYTAHSSSWRLAGEKKSTNYNHKTTIWVS
jgi:hypothetical protein